MRPWQPFFAAIDASPKEFDREFSPLRVVSTDARTFWAPTFFKRTFGFIRQDDRPGVPAGNVFCPGDQAQAAQVLHGYESLWLPAALLRAERRGELADAVFAASRHWHVVSTARPPEGTDAPPRWAANEERRHRAS